MTSLRRERVRRLRRGAAVVGLAFAAGALVDTALTWR